MKKSRHSTEQIIRILREADAMPGQRPKRSAASTISVPRASTAGAKSMAGCN
jgi:hypothetical protein